MACPTCGEAGEFVSATPAAEVSHFLARSLWAMHRLRIALCAMDRTDRARIASALIRELEDLAQDTNPRDDS